MSVNETYQGILQGKPQITPGVVPIEMSLFFPQINDHVHMIISCFFFLINDNVHMIIYAIITNLSI